MVVMEVEAAEASADLDRCRDAAKTARRSAPNLARSRAHPMVV